MTADKDPKVSTKWIFDIIPFVLFLIIGLLLFPSAGRDDAHITYWAAHALSKYGQILNYNGDRIEQSSSLLYTVLLAILTKLSSIDLPALGAISSVGCSLLAIGLLGPLSKLVDIPKTSSRLLLATATPFVYWGFGGQEASLASASILLFMIAYLRFIATKRTVDILFVMFAVSMYMTVRPEAVFVMVLFLLGIALAKLILREIPKSDFCVIAMVVGLFALLACWRLIYFGSLFPQPIAAKIGANISLLHSARIGLNYLGRSTRQYPVLVLLLFPGYAFVSKLKGLEIFKSRGMPIFVFSFAYLLFVIFSGGDWMEGARFVVPVLPLLIVASFMLAGGLLRNKKVLLLIVIMNIASSLLFARYASTGAPVFDSSYKFVDSASNSRFSYVELQNRVHYRDIPFLENVTPVLDSYITAMPERTFRVMSAQAGIVPFHLFQHFYGRLRFVDRQGLATREFTSCVLSKRWGRNSLGLLMAYKDYFILQDKFKEKCLIERPEFIYDLDSPRKCGHN